ncbi:MAG TPA: ATP-binding cassette domain-containing protein [Actinomycetota bacterium]|nr:ATP-binding cassette domain-containing protein [Actinomycetota bacterium]
MTAAVSFKDVEYTYPDATYPALVRTSFEIREGSFVLVAGATGSGKSTLLRAINGLVPHFSGGVFEGSVVAGDRNTLQNAPRDLADVVAFVPQEPSSSFVLDRVEDELAYAMENLGVPPERMRRRVEETLDLLNIESLRARSVRTLSGGEKQRVAIASALTAGPRILVLDEPTSQLDPQGAEDVLAALQRLVGDIGMTVILAEHRLERVAGFVDIAIGCRIGKPAIVGDPARILDMLGAGPPVARLARMVGWTPTPLTVRSARRQATVLEPGEAPEQAGATKGGEVILAAESIEAGYGRRRVLEGVSIDLRAGEIVALVGRNGSGKTTLLRALGGLHELDGGRVATANGTSPRPGLDVALCPQTPETVLFKDSVVEEIRATLEASGSGVDAARLLRDLGIEALVNRHPRDLSAGQRLLVAVGAIAATGAPVLLLDEPTRGLDAESKDRLTWYMQRRSEEGQATLFATHDVELVAEAASRVVVLAAGEIIADGSPTEVLSDSPVFAPQMARVFGPGWLTPVQVAAALGPPADIEVDVFGATKDST